MAEQHVEKARFLRCRCGHSKADHRGWLTRESTGRLISKTACVAGTTVARIGNWHAERVGGDRCQAWEFSLRATLRALLGTTRNAQRRGGEPWPR